MIDRAKELDTALSSEMSDSRKEARKNTCRKSEANFLRFLRTSEKPQNYQTLKIIGKGAFGEVRLVQRRHDGKIYALKSLIKNEMVSFEWSQISIELNTGAKGNDTDHSDTAQKRPTCTRSCRA
jgi:protein-serine/threonine kinase